MPKKILLADDSITIQKVVELTFSDGDYEVVATNNGNKAIQKLGEMKPDIILSDIIMPEKNGYELCEYVKSHPEFRRIPVILLTGTFEPFDPDRAEKAGCDAVITKPFESQSLIHKVEELIQQGSGSSSSSAESAKPEQSSAAPKNSDSADMPAGETKAWPLPKLDIGWSSSGSGSGNAGGSFSAGPEFSSTSAPPPPSIGSVESSAFKQQDDDIFSSSPAPAVEPESTSMYDEPVPSDTATRAFPKMSFEEIQRAAGAASSAPAAEEEPSGATKAFPKMSFEDLQRMSGGTETPTEQDEPPIANAAGWTAPEPASAENDWASPDADTMERNSPVLDSSPFGEAPTPSQSSFGSSDSIFENAPERSSDAWPSSPPVSPPETPAREAETPSPVAAGGSLSDEQVDRIARRVVELLSDQVVRNIAWEVIPDLAEMVVRERIRQLESEA